MESLYGKALGTDVYRARILMRNKLQKKLKDFEITPEQWNVINQISLNEGCNQKDLALKCLKDKAALTRILDILDKKGFIKRKVSPNDRREFLIYLTPTGKNFFKTVTPILMQHTQENFKNFTDEEVDLFQHLLKKLLSNLE